MSDKIGVKLIITKKQTRPIMQCRISEKIGIQAIIIRILLLGGIHWFVSSESRQLCSFDHVFYVPPLIIVWSQKVIINRSSCVLITHINHVLLFSNHDLTLVVTLRNEILTIVDFRIIVIWKEISLKNYNCFFTHSIERRQKHQSNLGGSHTSDPGS